MKNPSARGTLRAPRPSLDQNPQIVALRHRTKQYEMALYLRWKFQLFPGSCP